MKKSNTPEKRPYPKTHKEAKQRINAASKKMERLTYRASLMERSGDESRRALGSVGMGAHYTAGEKDETKLRGMPAPVRWEAQRPKSFQLAIYDDVGDDERKPRIGYDRFSAKPTITSIVNDGSFDDTPALAGSVKRYGVTNTADYYANGNHVYGSKEIDIRHGALIAEATATALSEKLDEAQRNAAEAVSQDPRFNPPAAA